MAKRYTRINWKNDATTALGATLLNIMDKGIKDCDDAIGDLALLNTNNKTDLVSAINELNNNLAAYKIINFSKDISVAGDQVITSVGFKSRAILLIATIPGVAGYMSIGAGDLTTHLCLTSYHNRVAGSFDISPNELKFTGTTGNAVTAQLTAISETGFTLTWAKEGTMTGTANIIAICLK